MSPVSRIFAPAPGGDLLDRGQVGGRHHRRLVDHEQVTGPHRQVPAGLVAVLDPAQEVGEVVAVGEPLGGQVCAAFVEVVSPITRPDAGVPPGLGRARRPSASSRCRPAPTRMSIARPEVSTP